MATATGALRANDRTSVASSTIGQASGGFAAMSRDAMIATFAAFLFVSAIGAALWFKGYSLSLAQLAALDEALASAPEEPTTTPSPKGDSPQPNAQIPPPPPIASEEKPGEEKRADEADLPLPIADEVPAPPKVDPPKAKQAPVDLPDDDFLKDMDLPKLDDEPKNPAPPKTEIHEEPAPPPAKKEPIEEPTLPPAPPIVAEKSADDLPIPSPPSLEPKADEEEPSLPPAPPAVAEEPASDLPAPPSPAPVAEEFPTGEIQGIRPIVESPPAPRARSVATTRQVEEIQPVTVTKSEPEQTEPTRTSSATRGAIPAPPGFARTRPVAPRAPTAPEPEVQEEKSPNGTSDVVARAQPSPGATADEPIVGRAEPIARVTSAPKAASTEPSAQTTTPSPSEEFLPLHKRGDRYIPLTGASSTAAREEFYAVNNLPTGGRHGAFGSTTVQALKRSPNDQPEVVAYDAKMYIALEGDSFETVARTMYKSEELAGALAKYNRSRAGITDKIPAGTRLRIPPIDVLEPAGNAAAREAFRRVDTSSAARSIAADTQSAVAPSPFDPRIPAAPLAQGAGPGQYQTSDNETFWSIAKKALGDGRRWREIYDINRDRVTNEINVPAGTVLRLPTSK